MRIVFSREKTFDVAHFSPTEVRWPTFCSEYLSFFRHNGYSCTKQTPSVLVFCPQIVPNHEAISRLSSDPQEKLPVNSVELVFRVMLPPLGFTSVAIDRPADPGKDFCYNYTFTPSFSSRLFFRVHVFPTHFANRCSTYREERRAWLWWVPFFSHNYNSEGKALE